MNLTILFIFGLVVIKISVLVFIFFDNRRNYYYQDYLSKKYEQETMD